MITAKLLRIALLISVVAVIAPLAHAKPGDAPSGGTAAPPPAPSFDGWTVKADGVASPESIVPIAKRLGAKISALRNVIYEVGWKRIQINVLLVADGADADAAVASLTKMKPAWSIVRKGTTLYEFVGKNDAIDAMKKASEQLSAR